MAERHLESGPSDWKSLIPPSDKGIALETYEECQSPPSDWNASLLHQALTIQQVSKLSSSGGFPDSVLLTDIIS